MPIQYNASFHGSRNVVFQVIKCDIFLTFVPNKKVRVVDEAVLISTYSLCF